MEKIRLGISACLLGENVRHEGLLNDTLQGLINIGILKREPLF